MFRWKSLWIVCFLALPNVGFGQADVPDSAVAEIIRRGSSVTYAGDGVRATEFAQVMGVPEDDSHKWFISLITTRNCAYCEKLQADWRTSRYLLAFANPTDAKQSWSHFNVYRADDPTQAWRWKNVKIGSYPTIIVQPPRNRQFGDPGTVVMQRSGYDGDPEQLANAMSSAIRQYVAKYTETMRGGIRQPVLEEQASGYDPPFNPISPDPGVPRVDNPFPTYPVTIPPTLPVQVPTPNITSLLFQLLGGTLGSPATTSLLLMVLIGVQVWRAYRKATQQPLLLDDTAFEQIRQLILSITQAQAPKQNAADPSSKG